MRLNKRPNFPLNKRYTSLAAAIAVIVLAAGVLVALHKCDP